MKKITLMNTTADHSIRNILQQQQFLEQLTTAFSADFYSQKVARSTAARTAVPGGELHFF